MANFRAYDEIVTKFLFDTCQYPWLDNDALRALCICAIIATRRGGCIDDHEAEFIAVLTGSVAEFYIEPMLSCVGDKDIMVHYSTELAIPAGSAPPTQLPEEFHSRVKVFEIVDISQFPGYVYLVLSYLLTECIDDDKYKAVQRQRRYLQYKAYTYISGGPAVTAQFVFEKPSDGGRVTGSGLHSTGDLVYCIRCLSWPTQASDWPTRIRNYCWPDSATTDRIVRNGCDVVRVAHRRCRRDEAKRRTQCRLSFSRAEIVLLNSWIPVQQIVYHMLRAFVKTERLTDSANNSDVATLSNYNIKTLMLWACAVSYTHLTLPTKRIV